MYLNHFNLSEKPFQITPDPRFLWLGEKHQEALATLKYAVLDCKGFLLLTGDVGTGKTTLIKALLNDLDDNTVVATVVDPNLKKLQFFNFLGRIFGLKEVFRQKIDFLSRFTQFLNNAHEEGKTVLLIIDEAQRLSKELLEEIRLLSNIEKEHKKLLNIFFVGQNEFNVLLMQKRSRALRQRITITYQIQPLTETETTQYIDFRLKVAGTQQKIFDDKAIREVFKFSRGYPRLINIICDHALLTAFVRDIKKVPASMVKECAKELTLPGENLSNAMPTRHPTHSRKSGRLPMAALGIALVFVLVTGVHLVDPGMGERMVHKGKLLYERLQDNTKRPESNPQAPDTGRPESGASQAPDKNDSQADVFRAFYKPSEDSPLEKEAPKDDIQEESIGPTFDDPTFEKQTIQQPSTPQSLEDNVDASPTEPIAEIGGQTPVPFSDNAVMLVPFNYDANELLPQAYKDLDRLAAAMGQDLDMDIVVEGYTDALGSRHYNMKLSEFRAQVVKVYLTAKGIAPSRIMAVGRAEENPVDANDTPAGRSANRRVEIRLKTKSDS